MKRFIGGPKKAFSKMTKTFPALAAAKQASMQRRYAQPGQDYRTVTPQQMAQQEALRQRQAAQAIGGKGGGIRQLPVGPGRPMMKKGGAVKKTAAKKGKK